MKLTRKCHGCGQDIFKDEMIQYSTLSGKTSYWFCKTCYEEKMARERFQDKVCQIFGIKSPGPLIWTQRKRLQDTYGYTDDAIVDCLDYISWRAGKKAQASSLAAAIINTEVKEYIVPVQENKKKKKEINLDDALLE